MEISKIIHISTAHITEQTSKLLEREADENNMSLSVYPKADFGWFISVPAHFSFEYSDVPDDLKKCLRFARENDCDWLCLDCDAEENDDLEIYIW